MDLLKKYWIYIVVVVLVYYLYTNYSKRKKAEDVALNLFNQVNAMSSQAKIGKAYEDEKASLIKLINNSNDKESAILSDLLNATIATFSASEQEKDKERSKELFAANLNKMQSDLVAKYGKDNVMKFKAKMDMYGFDI